MNPIKYKIICNKKSMKKTEGIFGRYDKMG